MPQHHGKRFKNLTAEFRQEDVVLGSRSDRAREEEREREVQRDRRSARSSRRRPEEERSERSRHGFVAERHGPYGARHRVRKGDNAKAAQEAGADIVGDQDLIDRVKGGFTEFDVAVATPGHDGASR